MSLNRDYIPANVQWQFVAFNFLGRWMQQEALSITHPTRWALETNTHSNKHTLRLTHTCSDRQIKGCGVFSCWKAAKPSAKALLMHSAHITSLSRINIYIYTDLTHQPPSSKSRANICTYQVTHSIAMQRQTHLYTPTHSRKHQNRWMIHTDNRLTLLLNICD